MSSNQTPDEPATKAHRTPRRNIVLSKEILEIIDEWRREQPDLPSRSEAIRRLIEKGAKA